MAEQKSDNLIGTFCIGLALLIEVLTLTLVNENTRWPKKMWQGFLMVLAVAAMLTVLGWLSDRSLAKRYKRLMGMANVRSELQSFGESVDLAEARSLEGMASDLLGIRRLPSESMEMFVRPIASTVQSDIPENLDFSRLGEH